MAIVGAVILEEWFEAGTVVTVFVGSEVLKTYCMELARERLSQGLAGLPRLSKLKDGRIIPVGEIEIGSVIILCAGDIVPIDGQVVSGVAGIDESSATGESWPKDKKVNDLVMAGSLVQNGYLEVKTTELAKDS